MDHVAQHSNDSEFRPLQHLPSSALKGDENIELRWSDDDTDDSECKSSDDNTGNTWLVELSTSSHSSLEQQSIGLDDSDDSDDDDDDEIDIESIPSELERCRDYRIKDCKNNDSNMWNTNERHFNHRQDLLQLSDDKRDCIFLSNVPVIRQLPKAPLQYLVTTKAKIHSYLHFYSVFITKTEHQDYILKLMQWSLWLIGAGIVPTASISNNRLLPKWIQKISYDICYARYVTRLLGLPVALEGAMSGSWATTSSFHKNPALDRTYQVIGNILAYSMVLYYPVEHVAFFLWMNPNAETIMNLPAETWFYMSMRCWLFYLVFEMIQCIIKYSELQKHQYTMRSSKKTDEHGMNDNDANEKYNIDKRDRTNDFDHVHTDKALNDEMYDVTLLFIRNIFYVVPCFHWSMSNWDTDPLLSDVTVNGFMWIEAVLCMYHAIYDVTKPR